jgi:hypothetical protein
VSTRFPFARARVALARALTLARLARFAHTSLTAMPKLAYAMLTMLCSVAGCSGTVSNDHPQAGGALAVGSSASAVTGGARTFTGGASSVTAGGVTSAGGALGLGGTLPASSGTSTTASSTGGAHGIDCSMVGCAAPPLCSTGCTEVCGCCPCSEGSLRGNLVCKNGCWADLGTGGASSTGGALSTGGKPATGGAVSAGGIASSGGRSSTTAGGVCATGCTFETTTSPFCDAGLAALGCHGSMDFQAISAIMQANGCGIAMSDAIRFCCPTTILTQCQ